MPKTPEQQADELVAKANELLEEAKRMREAVATQLKYPERPRWCYGYIDVKFSEFGKYYRYLVYLPGLTDDGVYTTGSRPGGGSHKSWEAFIDWLRSSDVYRHGALEQLQSGEGKVYIP